MALTALDPNTALLVVDLQKGVVGMPTVHPIAGVIEKARALLDAFRERGLPVVLINVDDLAPGRTEHPRLDVSALPSGWTDFIPELNQQPSDIVVTKKTWGAFSSSDIAEELARRSVTQVVVIGVATSAGVESTARQAYEAGLNVTLATDAMTDTGAEAHDCSVRNVFPRLGETGTASEVISLLPAKA
jgi:nicotinamidase-related amidase